MKVSLYLIPLIPDMIIFMSDSIAGGRKFRTFNVIDEYTREVHAIEVDTSLPAKRVKTVLERVGETWGFPETIICDNGPEFISIELDKWCYKKGIKLHIINPGKPTENCFIESFNGRFRDECLELNWFTSMFDAREIIEKWRLEYNSIRPHSSLNNLSPNEFRFMFEKENKRAEPLIASG